MKRLKNEKINWIDSTGFILIHVASILVIWAGISWVALITLLLTYGIRMFAITAGYHRYFSRRTFRTTRLFQFILSVLGTSVVQKGPLWWAAYHRHHHRFADTEADVHSPTRKGFWWFHVGWILCQKYKCTHLKLVHDLKKFPELKFLDRFHILAPVAMVVCLTGLGMVLNHFFPTWNTSGFQILVWGFFLSTVFLYHATFTVNSLMHKFGRRRFNTNDTSKNSFLISLLALEEGWHNNHHRFPNSERQDFYWWEVDISHYILRLLSWFKIVWDLRQPPREGVRRNQATQDAR